MRMLVKHPNRGRAIVKWRLAAVACALLLPVGATSAAQRQKHVYVQIENQADSGLCTSARQAVQAIGEDTIHGLFEKLRDSNTPSSTAVQVSGMSFHPLQTEEFKTVNDAGTQRTRQVAFYHLDVDNDGAKEMVTVVTGGHGAAGEGDTFYVLKNDLTSVQQPVRRAEFTQVSLEIGGRTHTFYGKDVDFAPAWYLYPFAFEDKNYLLIEGNRAGDRKHLVVALVAGAGLQTRCYF